MNINQVVKITGLTKKAIYYYESKGLIEPEYNPENGYRIFKENHIQQLSVIAALRQIDVSIEDIKKVLSNEKSLKGLFVSHLKSIDKSISSMENDKLAITSFIQNSPSITINNIDAENLVKLRKSLEFNQIEKVDFISRQFQRIFPGNLGKLYFLIISNYITTPIDNDQKKIAWLELIEDLDNIETVQLTPEIENFLNSNKFEEWVNRSQLNLKSSLKNVIEMEESEIKSKVDSNLEKHNVLNPNDISFMENFAKLQNYIHSNEAFALFIEKSKKNFEILCPIFEDIQKKLNFIKNHVLENGSPQFLSELQRIKDEIQKN